MAKRKNDSRSFSKTVSAGEGQLLSPPGIGPSRRFVALSFIALALCLACYLLRLDGAVGYLLDDAWYVLLAKALAAGQGYSLINSPSPGILPIYPPFFPLVLSPAFRLIPTFPENVWLLKSVSIAAMFGAAFLSYYYFRRYRLTPRPVAALLSTALLLNPALVFLATSTVMSECFFTALQLLAAVLVERCVGKNLNVRYLAYVGWPVVFPPPSTAETPFHPIYQSPKASRRAQGYNLRVLDLGPASSREDWLDGK